MKKALSVIMATLLAATSIGATAFAFLCGLLYLKYHNIFELAIIDNTKKVLELAIKNGGTTIRSYTSSEGVHGRFQQHLNVHNKENQPCPKCGEKIVKIRVGGRGTCYCVNCQKK